MVLGVQLHKALDHFKDHLRLERDASVHTQMAYQRDLGQLVTFLESLPCAMVQDVTAGMLREFCLHLRESDLQPRSYNRKLSAIRTFFSFCMRQGWLEKDPTTDLRNLPTQPKSPEPLDVEQMAKVLEVEGEGPLAVRDRALMELMYSTGMRVSEVVSLTVDQVTENPEEIRVVGKGNKERTVFLTDVAREWLQRYLREGRPQLGPTQEVNALFINHRGGSLTVRSVQRMVRRRTMAAGIHQKLTPHGVRHTAATHLLNHGLDLRELQEILGHESLSSTQVYTHVSVPRLKKVHGMAHPRAQDANEAS